MNFTVKLLIIISFAFAIESSYAAQPNKIKNVLFIIADDLKASVLACYGDKICQTPNLDKLASQSIVFDRAYCQGLSCGPSRTSLMHSRYLGSEGINLPEHLKNNGWYTVRVGKIYHMRVPYDIIHGIDGQDIPSSWTEKFNSKGAESHTPGDYACLNKNIFTKSLKNRESSGMKNRMFVSVISEGDGSDQPDVKSAEKTIELLNQRKNEPFFIATGLVRPHYPNVAPKEFFQNYPWEKIDLPELRNPTSLGIPAAGHPRITNSNNSIGKYPDNQKRMWSAYYATVEFMDRQIGRILDEVDRLGLKSNTAIIFLSDHGYHLGEHGFWQKNNLHEEVTRVPLIAYIPGLAPRRINEVTELVDIYPSLTELLGVYKPKTVQGKSFLPFLKNKTEDFRNSALSLMPGKKGYSIRTEDFSYIRYQNGAAELYNMNKDPKQLVNLIQNPEHKQTISKLDRELNTRLKEADLVNN
ncbi:iduronate-2-sulfatase [Lentisphaera araneosa HTCC2155]|uniref:Iduronate-2-sulfatase n=1 Tax=Lentisphaera araneosa HTCC2155 TaxID=313628 RepID=A6DG72_9BACT|nr:sulfatase [Lentisphaera araneosa]EDM29189.1 iduronate-2-sulfatase [Lentisphaera araneosa HTCC2155]